MPQGNTLSIRKLLILSALLTITVYLSGLFGGFLFDDFPNIVDNQKLQAVQNGHWLTAVFSSDAGPLKRPISMLSFAVDSYIWGLSPLAFKITNLVIHLLTGLLIYRLVLAIIPALLPSQDHETRKSPTISLLALAVSAVWLLHPLNVSSVLYIVQRMNQLAALFVVAGLLFYVIGRRQSIRNNETHSYLMAFGGLLFFGLAATLSKENGALIILFAAVIEVFCFKFRAADGRFSRPTIWFFCFCLLLPAATLLFWLILHPQYVLAGYAVRDFTLVERLLTQPRIIGHYLQWIFLPTPQTLGIFHDDITVSRGFLEPFTASISIAALIVLPMFAWIYRNRLPALGFGLAWFFIGHTLESTVIPLEMVYEHRNYLPMLGLIISCAVLLHQALARFGPRPLAGIGLVIITLFAVQTAYRSYLWGDPIRLAQSNVAHHPHSARSQYMAGLMTVYAGEAEGNLANAQASARRYFYKAAQLTKSDATPSTSLLLTYIGEKSVPEDRVNDLLYRIAQVKRIKLKPLLRLMDAATGGLLPASQEQIKAIVDAALARGDLRDSDRAALLAHYALYQHRRVGDRQASVSMTTAAAGLAPENPAYPLQLAELALEFGRPDIAQAQVLKAESLNVNGVYQDRIKRVNERLKRQSQSGNF